MASLIRGFCLLMVLSWSPGVSAEDGTGSSKLQKEIALAYNRGEAGAMASAFADDAVRVTPSGVFRGRLAIRSNLEDVIKSGLRNYTVRQTLSRDFGTYQLNVGEWEADFGHQHLRGYYSAILTTTDDSAKILEETVTIAVP